MKAIQYIEDQSFVVVNPDCPVITTEDALKAIEIAENEMKEKALAGFSQFVKEYARESGKTEISTSAEHYIKVFKKILETEK